MKHYSPWLLASIVIVLAAGLRVVPNAVQAAHPAQAPFGGCQPANIQLAAADPLVPGNLSPRRGAELTVTDNSGTVIFSQAVGNDGRVFLGTLPAGVPYTITVGDLPDLPGYTIQFSPACECRSLLDGYVQSYRISSEGAIRETGTCQSNQACSSVRLVGQLLPDDLYPGAAYSLRNSSGVVVWNGTVAAGGLQEIGRVLSGRAYRLVIPAAGDAPAVNQVIHVPCNCEISGGLLQLEYYWISSSYVTPRDRDCRVSALPLMFKNPSNE